MEFKLVIWEKIAFTSIKYGGVTFWSILSLSRVQSLGHISQNVQIPLFFRRCHWSSWENRRELLSLQTLASAMLHWDPFYIFYHFPTKHSGFNCTWRELNWNIMKRLILQFRLDLVLHLSLMFRIFHIWSSSLDCRGMFAASIRPSWLPSLLILSASGSILFFSSSTNKNIFKLNNLWSFSIKKSSNALKK